MVLPEHQLSNSVLPHATPHHATCMRELCSCCESHPQEASSTNQSTKRVDPEHALCPTPSDRQFFLGTEVQYLPMSFVRDTCGVKVDRKDDVHAKQRLGDLPKPLRWGESDLELMG